MKLSNNLKVKLEVKVKYIVKWKKNNRNKLKLNKKMLIYTNKIIDTIKLEIEYYFCKQLEKATTVNLSFIIYHHNRSKVFLEIIIENHLTLGKQKSNVSLKLISLKIYIFFLI